MPLRTRTHRGTTFALAAALTVLGCEADVRQSLDLVDEHREDEAVVTAELPGDIEVTLVASAIEATDALELSIRSEPSRTTDPSGRHWSLTVENHRDEAVLVVVPVATDADEVVSVRPVDLPYERGEVVYVDAPTSPVRWIEPRDTLRLGGLVRTDGDPPAVCLEVVEEDRIHRGVPESTGDEVDAHVRVSDAPVSVVCGGADGG